MTGSGEDLTRADFSRESLQGRQFVDARLVGADFSEAELEGVVFERCDLSGAELTSAVFDRCAFLGCTFEGARLFGSSLTGCKLTGSTFLRTQLRPLVVDGGDWSYVSLRGADLRGVALRGLRLVEADLSAADLSGCDLSGSELSRAQLRGVRLSGADLRGAVLDGCDVDGVDWSGVRIDLAQAILLARARGAVVEDSGGTSLAAQAPPPDQPLRRAHTAHSGSCRQVPARRCSVTAGSNPPAWRWYSATTPGRSCSSTDSHPRTALLGKHRLEKVHTDSPPGRRTRATSPSTSTGRTR